jgi:hypothetical protein
LGFESCLRRCTIWLLFKPRLEANDGSSVVRYLWDQSFGLPQLALERTGAGSLIRRYLYGQGRISMTTGGSSFYYQETC